MREFRSVDAALDPSRRKAFRVLGLGVATLAGDRAVPVNDRSI
jgi:hypothetical protein